VPAGERRGEDILVDDAANGQGQVDRAGHLGVIGPLPGPWRKGSGIEVMTVGRDEELRTERVAKGRGREETAGRAQEGQGAFASIFPEPLGELLVDDLHVMRRGAIYRFAASAGGWHAHRVDWSLAPWTLTWDEVDPGRHPFDPDSASRAVRSLDPASEFPLRLPPGQPDDRDLLTAFIIALVTVTRLRRCPFTGSRELVSAECGSGGSQVFPSMALRMASSAVVPWAAAESR